MEDGGNRRKPSWLRVSRAACGKSADVRRTLAGLGLATVCSEAACPNIGRCFSCGTAAFLILGGICTRACGYCAIEKAAGRRLPPPDEDEPERVAMAVAAMGLRFAVVTSVTRDDLPDGGASAFAATIRAIRTTTPGTGVEVLTPDFQGDFRSLETVAGAIPDVFNHNIETVERLFPRVRPGASFRRSLDLLSEYSRMRPGMPLKSGLMLGLGEEESEIAESLEALRRAGVRMLTLGQYLQPVKGCVPVERFIPPDEFDSWRERALAMGFGSVASGPLVRSSFGAGDSFEELSGHDG